MSEHSSRSWEGGGGWDKGKSARCPLFIRLCVCVFEICGKEKTIQGILLIFN